MTARRDPDELIHRFLLEGSERLHDQVYDAVRATIEQKRQRVVIGPWRMPQIMNRYVPIGLGAAAVVVAVAVGIQLVRPPDSSPSGAIGGTVTFEVDGAPATTKVDAVADGASLSGTAVTTLVTGTHTVRLECARRDGDTWALAGTIEQSTVPGEGAGQWSAVIVKDGSPQQIGIWFSDPKAAGSDCAGWVAAIDLRDLLPEMFQPVTSGALVPPSDLASTPMQAPSSPSGAVGGTVGFEFDGAPATTEVDAEVDGASLSGTAVTTFAAGTHTVRLECAARDGDTWAVAGTTEQTSVSGERAGDWSAVVVRDGSPQRIGIWISDPKSAGVDCAGWLAAIDLADIGPENFNPVTSGALVPPPGLAP